MFINNLEIAVEHKNIKNLHLSVYPPDGRVRVSAPLFYPNENIRLYVLQKWSWILEKQDKVRTYSVQPEREYVSGEAHFFKGECYRLKVVRDSSIKKHIERNGDYITMFVKESDQKKDCEKLLYDFYKAELSPILHGYIEKWTKVLDVSVCDFKIQKMKTRWGSCNPKKKTLLFNTELAKKDLNCIEYVVLHEAAHLIERTHNERFKSILDRYMPDWENRKRTLNERSI